MFQNYLLQIVVYIVMEFFIMVDVKVICNEKVKLFQLIWLIVGEDIGKYVI